MSIETHLLSFLSYLDTDVETLPSNGRIRNMPPRGYGYGSNEETYACCEDAYVRATSLARAGLVEWIVIYQADSRYPLGRKRVWEWSEGESPEVP